MTLAGRVAIVTGAARGLGREHALLLGAEGARVVVNDIDAEPAQMVVGEIVAAGGEAVAAPGDVATWETGEALVDLAVETYGDLHVLVNNAGNVADRLLVNMTEDDWDHVVRSHLKGHFVPTRWAAAYWRQRSKGGSEVRASVVCTTSTSGLVGNPGQSNYGAAKAGVAAFTVVAAAELGRYGVRVNAVAPLARTRLTESVPALAERMAPPSDPGAFDPWHPANVSPLVAWLASAGCEVTGKVFLAQGGKVELFRPWSVEATVEKDGRWTPAELGERLR
ncbi:MAG: 3-oxoacyl-[acyl-carrier protein] reductase [uncultured Acidimicrobiales bacterium]|uniref:3-oxoacyl-[acyl-carrier protein] reductase n=1 Tax=uncultured Acidimicrobiales bacterium TaxID=310071 RepID=A0A6J4J205_9ACTN|nr:MAG: 3-oxoacyl-[acyl-carrier protein] reductase [uncultured Acidimicrobiales bacterium]